MKIHEKYINRCIQIGENGLGTTAPNPMVGSVIVHEHCIIGEGFTSPFGGNHAEVNAIHSVKDKALLKNATLYVTLEPCSHFGKTPPCSDLIIKHKIPKVVIGCLDENPQVAGKGIANLEAAGCRVTVGILEAECKQHHKRFFTFHNKKRPYVILKWAETQDGFIAPKHKEKQEPVWITNPYSRQLVHKWRAQEQAILVGTNTVWEDNPSLTVRDWTGRNPLRFVLDQKLKLPQTANIYNRDAETLIITSEASKNKTLNPDWNLKYINWNLKHSIAKQICSILFKNNINSVIIEGGAQTLQNFINENLWDEARVFTGTNRFGTGVAAPQFSAELISETQLLNDTLIIYANN
ncbi:bifunctional diaminohydroxyphosphoribosylaminopyrimidine deaminase/5-amino-6-(5-phosphoribosylamino)uracil reductase RibD [Subsaximicrobium wynnwilliamsii]|uniref:Riboflavin biosynthesis protein RibD n=1 Tax=Subsaximicrobium wynnwilliamsii TaxID=291179 RepID=A0A5C6ZNR8_9FLAO|nr:bifunctional diaminohydroxyphosphoribosylaminopyrimidine deaminase/5-amino-6-(5-phosphoribosylamino)uracil reductase RibD [Subsaximicrobium wynnwilliamsii]TXD85172.1 bifunctional diaminohydroxyphosphoribosylaminopyrimidine deaminase/5-amino-6-(5-phosphoribosylamino)uracil reductase RibD [Subsaximicrobium wynnwilliamsii]TXD91215.1 bifunctional diaminohydroxyphosphoribosylaminopyrimidine deaminase/5-amino-6-(5-phosphoribosylamino)uracil reductase RibD [Subsaximicrobium wynnwilliamsii]TXE04730.1